MTPAHHYENSSTIIVETDDMMLLSWNLHLFSETPAEPPEKHLDHM